MCTVSMIADDWTKRHDEYINPNIFLVSRQEFEVSRQEFEDLKNELAELKKLLIAAKIYDTATGQKDCEQDEKIKLFKRLGELCGLNMEEVFK